MKNKVMLMLFLLFTGMLFGFKQNAAVAKKEAVLVFSLTKGYRHESIADGIKAIKKLGLANHFDVDTTEDVSVFTVENLKRYKALVFLSPTGSGVFNDAQKQAFKQYINQGGGFVGIHAASDCNFEWAWYGKMVGGFFDSHPKIQKAKLEIVMPKNKMVAGLPQPWLHEDEWYNFKDFNREVKVLVKVDEASYQGGNMKNDHPISWYHEFDGGKVFYTALGHTKACYTDPFFLAHLLAGIKWAMK